MSAGKRGKAVGCGTVVQAIGVTETAVDASTAVRTNAAASETATRWNVSKRANMVVTP